MQFVVVEVESGRHSVLKREEGHCLSAKEKTFLHTLKNATLGTKTTVQVSVIRGKKIFSTFVNNIQFSLCNHPL